MQQSTKDQTKESQVFQQELTEITPKSNTVPSACSPLLRDETSLERSQALGSETMNVSLSSEIFRDKVLSNGSPTTEGWMRSSESTSCKSFPQSLTRTKCSQEKRDGNPIPFNPGIVETPIAWNQSDTQSIEFFALNVVGGHKVPKLTIKQCGRAEK